ncbi:MAG: zf-HC2 domain-containing protein [Ignavibacteriales bacterium]|nr:zf-HC2 domain-containing protein [Ignavibacteriales bacterium]
MSHSSMRRLASAFVDGEINELDRNRVQRHLLACPECRAYERGLRSLSDDIRASADANLPASFPYTVMRAVRKDEEDVRQWFPVERAARRLLGVLCAVVILFVGVGMMITPAEPVLIEPYLAGEPADSSVIRTLLTKDSISKDDVLLAAVTRK